eukprot:CAMPEP_0170521788 /NCGR_PEP_ID=MMETSP0209-20121228/7166_1 /TAXON_ID=665100 ORGANISM="Litonotus pictus, Strain P1" /NCGR_SAMPLE_ID=MMETSP0209 /ASSEMBLY_ACC=CAM_ASM_000301 /LENGTH=430 /DNA_ID=CAMNT_0010808865 /DNA_START=2087 /DNA_END=3379 /DNA_ORIENTATION=-
MTYSVNEAPNEEAREPIMIERGIMQYLVSSEGRVYLDTVNNVAHIGHEHPELVKAAQLQNNVLNTNTRYLHRAIIELAEELLKKLPKELSVVHFVNSGSEANELALRMAKNFTNSEDIITVDHGYYGNTQTCINLSAYKFNGPGGRGCNEYTNLVNLPNLLRNNAHDKPIEDFVKEVASSIKNIEDKGRKICGFISESIVGCGGQIVLPQGYLKEVYGLIKKSGGVCLADEVQTGFGRLGKYFWGFELHGVIPDIVTVGKPFGNGHPLGAVVCRKEMAEKFNNGMEYFSTFGGNPVSCTIGKTVLEVIEKEGLQKNAFIVGSYFKEELEKLKDDYSIIADIRGEGLFFGMEFGKVDKQLKGQLRYIPYTAETSYFSKRMVQFGILVSVDGPNHNVIKIKPPLCFSQGNVDEFIYFARIILEEDFMIGKSK